MSQKPVRAGVTAGSSRLWTPAFPWFTGAQATGGGRLRGCVEPQATSDTSGCADFRRREGSQADCLGLFQTAQGPGALDPAVVGEQGRWNSISSSVPATQRLGERSKKHSQ